MELLLCLVDLQTFQNISKTHLFATRGFPSLLLDKTAICLFQSILAVSHCQCVIITVDIPVRISADDDDNVNGADSLVSIIKHRDEGDDRNC